MRVPDTFIALGALVAGILIAGLAITAQVALVVWVLRAMGVPI